MARKRQAPATVSGSPKKPRVMHCKSCDGNPPITVCGCRKKSRKTGQPTLLAATLPPNIDNAANDLANLLQLMSSPNSGTLSDAQGSLSSENSLPSQGAASKPEVPIAGLPTPSVPANYDPVVDPSLESDGALPPAHAAGLVPRTAVATPPALAFPSTDGTSPTAGGEDTLVLLSDGLLTDMVDGNKDEGTSVDAPPLYTISQQDDAPPSTQPGVSDSDSDNRPRATAKNPIYGKIDGCYKGNDEFTFHRTTPLRPVMMDRTEATARYRREILDLALRAERLSCETGCWLFLAARHPNGGQRMVHYSSPKLRRQGLKEINEIANQFNQLLNMMNEARNDNGMDLQRDRDAAIAEKQAADAKVAAMVLALENMQNEANLLRAQLGKGVLSPAVE